MDSRKHIYFITVGDIQHLAAEKIGRNLGSEELPRVVEQILDRIQWFEVVEEAIQSEAEG